MIARELTESQISVARGCASQHLKMHGDSITVSAEFLVKLCDHVRNLQVALAEQTARAERLEDVIKVVEWQRDCAQEYQEDWERVARWLAGQLEEMNTGATASDLLHLAQSETEKERGE